MANPKHHVELPDETEIVTSFAVEVATQSSRSQADKTVDRTRTNVILIQCGKV